MSRLTFRDKATDVAWQKQLRDKYLDEGIPPVPHLDVSRATVRPVSRKLAEQIILKYEWLGTMAQTGYHYGIFFGLFCAGVVCIATNGTGAAGAYQFEQFGIKRQELATLARGACVHWSPKGANSKLVSWGCKLLKTDCPQTKLIVAYSDSEAGEIGTIYQACNWVYTGKTEGVMRADMEIISPLGRVYNRRILGDFANKNTISTKQMKSLLRQKGWTMQPGNPKGRYVYILDKRDKPLIRRIEAMRQPYPKRADS